MEFSLAFRVFKFYRIKFEATMVSQMCDRLSSPVLHTGYMPTYECCHCGSFACVLALIDLYDPT